MKICRPDNTRGGFLDCGWHFSTASNGSVVGARARDHPRSNLSARVIALAGIPLLDRKKFSGQRVSQLITQRSWNSECCEIRVIGNRNWLVRYLVTSLYLLIKRTSWSVLPSVSQSEIIIALNGSVPKNATFFFLDIFVVNIELWLIEWWNSVGSEYILANILNMII